MLPGVRVLTYGERIAVGSDGQDRSNQEKDPRPPRTAVLAVPEDGVARLMLASQAGSLRLAIRSKDEELYRRGAGRRAAASVAGRAERGAESRPTDGAPQTDGAERAQRGSARAGGQRGHGLPWQRHDP